MKAKMFFVILTAMISSISFAQENEIKINFEKGTWSEILQKAKEEDKLIFVDVYATWCSPCKWMDKNVFTNDTVAEFYNQNFICVKIDAEKEEGPKIGREYNAVRYPTFLFIAGDGELKYKSTGKKDVKKFVQLGKNALNPEEYLSVFHERHEKGERDPQFLMKYIQKLREAGLPRKDIIDEFFEAEKDWFSKEGWEMIQKYANNYDSEYFQFLRDNREKFESLYGDEVSEKIRKVWFNNLMNKNQKAILITALTFLAIGLISTFYWIFIGVRKLISFFRKKKIKPAL